MNSDKFVVSANKKLFLEIFMALPAGITGQYGLSISEDFAIDFRL